MNQSEENALLSRAKAGSKPAFTSLMAEHESGLYRFLLVRSRTRDDAEDAMQEAFISAYRYIHSYDSRWRFSTWLYRIALRELAKLPQSDCGDPAEEQTDYNALDPLQACIEAEDSENLWLLARKKLGGESFVALWLRYAEDMSIKEVAHAMGRSAPGSRLPCIAQETGSKTIAKSCRSETSRKSVATTSS